MPRPQPTWRRAFDKVERTVGVPLENVANSNRFVEVMTVGIRARRAAKARVAGVVHGLTGGLLHAVNIPTRDDVRVLNAHLITLAGELRAIEQERRRSSQQERTAPPTGVARPVRAVRRPVVEDGPDD